MNYLAKKILRYEEIIILKEIHLGWCKESAMALTKNCGRLPTSDVWLLHTSSLLCNELEKDKHTIVLLFF